MSADPFTPEFSANRLCLDFANLPFASGDQTERPIFWDEFVDFLAAKQIVSEERSAHIRVLVETDPRAAENLLTHAERLGRAQRLIFRAIVKGQRIHLDWTEPINQVLRVTEGHGRQLHIAKQYRFHDDPARRQLRCQFLLDLLLHQLTGIGIQGVGTM